ncbi:alpha/beta hydrolase [Paraburkholderia madseniana]|uniref:alpha/beta fold hydrolase n=1 Tax=Paraburkholderia madseniana TaxID=2599607 RepID=UPI0038BD8382
MDVMTVGQGEEIVVAVHGIQGTRVVWMPLAVELSEVASFVLPNLRGRGAAFRGSLAHDYRLDAFADDLTEVIETVVGERPYTLAGWSMGVSVALTYLARARRRPARLILMSGSPGLSSVHWFEAHDDAALLEEIAARERRLGLHEAANHQAVAWTWKSIRSTNQCSMLASIDIPALIVHGSDDIDSPVAHAQWLADGIEDARLYVIDGAGHGLAIENTNVAAAAVRRFLNG